MDKINNRYDKYIRSSVGVDEGCCYGVKKLPIVKRLLDGNSVRRTYRGCNWVFHAGKLPYSIFMNVILIATFFWFFFLSFDFFPLFFSYSCWSCWKTGYFPMLSCFRTFFKETFDLPIWFQQSSFCFFFFKFFSHCIFFSKQTFYRSLFYSLLLPFII